MCCLVIGIEFDEDDIREVKRARPLPIFSFDLETAEEALKKNDEYLSNEKHEDQTKKDDQ